MRPALALLLIATSLHAGAQSAAPAAALLPEEQAAVAVHEASIGSVVTVHISWDDKSAPLDPDLRKLFKLPDEPAGRDPRRERAIGTGVVWDAAGHVVAMAGDAVRPGARVEVVLADGSRHDTTVIGSDATLNVAVLQIAGPVPGLHPARLGSSATLRVGQYLFAFGSAWGRGVVMLEGMLGGISSAYGGNGRNSLLVNAAINPGNAGGPVLDTGGRLVGMVHGTYGNGSTVGLVLALPVDDLAAAVPRLIADGRISRAQLGLSIVDPQDETTRANLPAGMQPGVPVLGVDAGGPGERAGLRARVDDAIDVITGIDGAPVRGYPDLRAALDRLRPGQVCTLAVWRAGKTINVPVTLGAEKAK